MDTGIYIILNNITKDSYVGSAKSFKNRWARHRKDLRGNKHHSIFLQRAWDKYKECNFTFSILETCEECDLADRENYHIQKVKPVYNICPIAYSQFGRKLSEEHKAKIRKSHLEKKVRPPVVNRISVEMLDKETSKHIKTFISVSDACYYIGKDYTYVSCITECCRGVRKSAFGYKWKFPDQVIQK